MYFTSDQWTVMCLSTVVCYAVGACTQRWRSCRRCRCCAVATVRPTGGKVHWQRWLEQWLNARTQRSNDSCWRAVICYSRHCRYGVEQRDSALTGVFTFTAAICNVPRVLCVSVRRSPTINVKRCSGVRSVARWAHIPFIAHPTELSGCRPGRAGRYYWSPALIGVPCWPACHIASMA